MKQQKENKDINSILAKTSKKKHFREKKRLFLQVSQNNRIFAEKINEWRMRQIEESIFLFVSKAIVKEQKYEQTDKHFR